MHDKLRDLMEEGIDLQVCVGQVRDSALISRRIGATAAFLVAAPKYLNGRKAPEKQPIFKSTTALSITGGGGTMSDGSPPPRAPSRCAYAAGFAPATRKLCVALLWMAKALRCCPFYSSPKISKRAGPARSAPPRRRVRSLTGNRYRFPPASLRSNDAPGCALVSRQARADVRQASAATPMARP